MFDNLGTALVQAFGFFAVFGFFVYQTLFADNKPDNSQKNKVKAKAPKINNTTKKESKKGLFNRKSDISEENVIVKKKGLFSRKTKNTIEQIKPKKKGWFR